MIRPCGRPRAHTFDHAPRESAGPLRMYLWPVLTKFQSRSPTSRSTAPWPSIVVSWRAGMPDFSPGLQLCFVGRTSRILSGPFSGCGKRLYFHTCARRSSFLRTESSCWRGLDTPSTSSRVSSSSANSKCLLQACLSYHLPSLHWPLHPSIAVLRVRFGSSRVLVLLYLSIYSEFLCFHCLSVAVTLPSPM